jgi:hypothetical protein
MIRPDRIVNPAAAALFALILGFIQNSEAARTIEFAGRIWNVKSGTGLGPGPNNWSDSIDNVWVDSSGYLHLKIRQVASQWYCSEVWTTQATGYGIYRFYLVGRVDQLDKNVVFSPFLYYDDSHEVDIEFSKWGSADPSAPNAQFVVQPASIPGNRFTFEAALSGDYTTHYFNWQASGITFKGIYGHYSEPPDPNYLIAQWTYSGASNPLESQGLPIHINLWLMNGLPPSDGQDVELVVSGVDYPPVALTFHRSGDDLVLTWIGGTLLSADELAGPWTQVTGATSPWTIVPKAPKKFFRLGQ